MAALGGWTQLARHLWTARLLPRQEVESGNADYWEFINQAPFWLVALLSYLGSVPGWKNSVHSGLAPLVPTGREWLKPESWRDRAIPEAVEKHPSCRSLRRPAAGLKWDMALIRDPQTRRSAGRAWKHLSRF